MATYCPSCETRFTKVSADVGSVCPVCRGVIGVDPSTIHSISITPTWYRNGLTAIEVQKEFSKFEYEGPGWYFMKNGNTVLLIPEERTWDNMWDLTATWQETFQVFVWNDWSPAENFGLVVRAPLRVDDRPEDKIPVWNDESTGGPELFKQANGDPYEENSRLRAELAVMGNVYLDRRSDVPEAIETILAGEKFDPNTVEHRFAYLVDPENEKRIIVYDTLTTLFYLVNRDTGSYVGPQEFDIRYGDGNDAFYRAFPIEAPTTYTVTQNDLMDLVDSVASKFTGIMTRSEYHPIRDVTVQEFVNECKVLKEGQ
jgi:hypothetical protein